MLKIRKKLRSASFNSKFTGSYENKVNVIYFKISHDFYVTVDTDVSCNVLKGGPSGRNSIVKHSENFSERNAKNFV